MLVIRLTRIGRKNQPKYRIVVAEKSVAVKSGKVIDSLGSYNPVADPKELTIDLARYEYWCSKGAKPSETVARLALKAK